MTTYWLDPFLEASTQGNGTTDTGTKNGTYAAPFSLLNFGSSSSGNITTANGVTLSNGDEVRIKGLPFTTLFESKGNVYAYTSSQSSALHTLRPVTGNSSFDATISNSTSSLFAFQNSDITSFLPNHPHPAFFSGWYTSSSTQLIHNIGRFTHAVIRLQLQYTSASTTGIEVFRLKDTYANPTNWGSNNSYWFAFTNKVKLTAGWTSETAQEGYSIIEDFHTSSYRYSFINYSTSSKTHFDCERLVFCNIGRSSSGLNSNTDCRIDFSDYSGEARDYVAPMFVTGTGRMDDYHIGIYNGDTTVYPYIAGGGNSTYDYIQLKLDDKTATRTGTFKNLLTTGYVYIYETDVSCTLKIGNMYCHSYNFNNQNRPFYEYIDETFNVTFLQNSVYYLTNYSSSAANVILAIDPSYVGGTVGTVTYESGLKKPGIAPLDNLDFSGNSIYGPDSAGTISSTVLFKETKEISSNNEWFDPIISREGSNPIEYLSLGKLVCNGNNFRTTAHNIQINTDTASNSTDAPKYLICSGEHNDYDGIPISLLGDPYTAGSSYATLMYNDTVSSTNVLVGQWAGTTGGASTQSWIPLELSVPSYTAGSSNLRVTVSAAYADGSSNSASGSILLRAWHRDTTQSGNFRVYSSSATTIAAGGNPASPTTVTLNLTNVPASGQEDITSVIVGIRLNFSSNTNIQKYYITNAAIETY